MAQFISDESGRNLKILVIHPNDPTTDDLCLVYQDIPNITVVRGGVHKDYVHELIQEHDRIIMMGHGDTGGLFSAGEFIGTGRIIDEDTVPLLRNKECIYIWYDMFPSLYQLLNRVINRCFASVFVVEHELSGFFTGMFISETVEAEMFLGHSFVSSEDITASNRKFAELIRSKMEVPLLDLVMHVKSEYRAFGEDRLCDVVRYNCCKIGLAGGPVPPEVHGADAGECAGKRVLVIHPADTDSEFARNIYVDWPDVTVVTQDMTKTEVTNLIASHDRIFLIGNGDGQGLHGQMQFGDKQKYGDCHWIVDSSSVTALRDKECVFLW